MSNSIISNLNKIPNSSKNKSNEINENSNSELFKDDCNFENAQEKTEYIQKKQNLNLNNKFSKNLFKTGRWRPDEHKRFVEAIIKYGKEWKKVENFVGSRSSSQARSHAQKFFVKMKKTDFLNIGVNLNDESKNSQLVSNNMNSDQYLNIIKKMNNIIYDTKTHLKQECSSTSNVCFENNFEKFKNKNSSLKNNIKILSDKTETSQIILDNTKIKEIDSSMSSNTINDSCKFLKRKRTCSFENNETLATQLIKQEDEFQSHFFRYFKNDDLFNFSAKELIKEERINKNEQVDSEYFNKTES